MADVFELVGIRPMDFTGRDGNRVRKTSFFYTFNDKGIQGVGTDKVSINTDELAGMEYVPAVGDLFGCVYNKYGKVAAFIPVE